MDLRVPLPATGNAGGTLQRCAAATLWQAGSSEISSVTCMVSDGNCWDLWATL